MSWWRCWWWLLWLGRGVGEKPRPPLDFTPFQSQEWNSVLTDYALGGCGGANDPYNSRDTKKSWTDLNFFFPWVLMSWPRFRPPRPPGLYLTRKWWICIVHASLCWTSSHTSQPCLCFQWIHIQIGVEYHQKREHYGTLRWPFALECLPTQTDLNLRVNIVILVYHPTFNRFRKECNWYRGDLGDFSRQKGRTPQKKKFTSQFNYFSSFPGNRPSKVPQVPPIFTYPGNDETT